VAPVLQRLTNDVLSGTFPAASPAYPATVIDLYRATRGPGQPITAAPVVHP